MSLPCDKVEVMLSGQTCPEVWSLEVLPHAKSQTLQKQGDASFFVKKEALFSLFNWNCS